MIPNNAVPTKPKNTAPFNFKASKMIVKTIPNKASKVVGVPKSPKVTNVFGSPDDSSVY